MEKKFTSQEFAEQLAAAVDVGQKIDIILDRVEHIARKVDRLVDGQLEKLENASRKVDSVNVARQAAILFTVEGAAHALSVSKASVRLMIRLGYLPAQKMGHGMRIHRKDLEAVAKNGIPDLWPKDRPWPRDRAAAAKKKS